MCICNKVKSVCVSKFYLSIASSIMDQTGMFSGAAQLCDGLRLTHHPPHTLQMTVLQQTHTDTCTQLTLRLRTRWLESHHPINLRE